MSEHPFRPNPILVSDDDRVLILDPMDEKWRVIRRAALDEPPWNQWEWESASEFGDTRDRFIAGLRRTRKIECLRCGQPDLVNNDGQLCDRCRHELDAHKGLQ